MIMQLPLTTGTMKRTLCVIAVFIAVFVAAIPSFGQKRYAKNEHKTALTIKVTEKGSGKPVQMATVYIVPAGDTLATAFTFTNKKGVASLSDYPPGKYMVNVQILGFKAYKEAVLLEARRLWTLFVELEEDIEELEGARVTAMGDLVTVKGDTLIYNATSFRTTSNASLGDLLKKMPGIEVEKGRVKVNGEPVRRITVEGKTFFFGDQSKALENLPAFVVNKVKVIEKESRDRFGVAGKETEMDIKLKDEYRNGWFGRASAEGGASVKDRASERFEDPAHALFNAKLYSSFYGDKDQFTILGGGNNVNVNQLSHLASGISDIASCGANFNTSRIWDLKTTASSSYDYKYDINRSESERTSFLASGEQIITNSHQNSSETTHSTKAEVSTGNLSPEPWVEGLEIGMRFRYDENIIASECLSSTSSSGETMNNSVSRKTGKIEKYKAGIHYSGRNFFGKESQQRLIYSGSLNYHSSQGNGAETSLTRFGESMDDRSLIYVDKTDGVIFHSSLSYSIPISSKWSIVTGGAMDYGYSKDIRDAGNTPDHSRNEYYSKYAIDKSLHMIERCLAQFRTKLGGKKRLSTDFGLCLFENYISHYSKAFVSRINKNDGWHINAGPVMSAIIVSGWGTSYGVRIEGKSNAPSKGTDSSPILEISDPINVSTGNIFLKPGYQQVLHLSLRLGQNIMKGGSLDMRLQGSVDFNEITRASWFDSTAVRYSIPVNAKRPRYASVMNITYVQPLNKHKSLNLTVTPRITLSAASSYVSKGPLRGLDKNSFDYAQTMEWFYGDRDGSEFYSGRSGFMENRTLNLNWSVKADLKYEIWAYSLRGGTSVNNIRSRYSASPAVKVNNWRFNCYAEVLWQNKGGWEAEARFDFNGYHGFSGEFNRPEYLLNLKLAKSLKSFTLSLSAYDILGSAKSFSHIASAEYVEDRHRNNLGRCILAGLSYNFGKWDKVTKAVVKAKEQRGNL